MYKKVKLERCVAFRKSVVEKDYTWYEISKYTHVHMHREDAERLRLEKARENIEAFGAKVMQEDTAFIPVDIPPRQDLETLRETLRSFRGAGVVLFAAVISALVWITYTAIK